jgi:hypothetical protein
MRKDSSQTKHNDKSCNCGGVYMTDNNAQLMASSVERVESWIIFKKYADPRENLFMRPRQRRPVNEVTEIQDGYILLVTHNKKNNISPETHIHNA